MTEAKSAPQMTSRCVLATAAAAAAAATAAAAPAPALAAILLLCPRVGVGATNLRVRGCRQRNATRIAMGRNEGEEAVEVSLLVGWLVGWMDFVEGWGVGGVHSLSCVAVVV